MLGTRRHLNRGVTVLEVLISVFVLLIGITGVIALFPVGVRFSQMSTDDAISAMTAQRALAAVRVQSNTLGRLGGYVAGSNEDGDTLSWNGTISRGIDEITGEALTMVGEHDTGFPDRHTHMGVAFDGADGESFDVMTSGAQANQDDRALMLMTSGRAMWKLFRLDRDTNFTTSRVASTKNGIASFPSSGIKEGDEFRLIGARDKNKVWVTVPDGFYENGPSTGYKLGPGAAEGYGYLAILNRVKGISGAYRVTILVYKGYSEDMPPEGNDPAIACFTTILSGDLLR